MKENLFDLCVIGGGVNGAGIAREASGKGLKVILCEKDDLSEGTSSRSGKLIHGGLRYLEYYQFRLVREALREREVLLKCAPHIIRPLRFVLPHSPEQRPIWMIRIGLFLYDHLGGRKILPKSVKINLSGSEKGTPLKPKFSKGFEFSDCWVDDARLVILNALDAHEKGAKIQTRTEVIFAKRTSDCWLIRTKDHFGNENEIFSHSLVNAAGPWVYKVLQNIPEARSKYKIRLVKGSHLVTKKFWNGKHSYLFQNTDKRVIFANSYTDNLCLIGTTDIPYKGRTEDVEIDEKEVDYLLKSVNRYLRTDLQKSDIVQSFSGVRPLFDDNSENPSAVTRDYLFEVGDVNGKLPLLSVLGGKITTYRELAEKGMRKLERYFPELKPYDSGTDALPGGNISNYDFETWIQAKYRQYPFLSQQLVRQYGNRYGTRIGKLLNGINSEKDLGRKFGSNFYETEVHYLVKHEWAKKPEDITERRTKHILQMNSEEISAFTKYFNQTYSQNKS